MKLKIFFIVVLLINAFTIMYLNRQLSDRNELITEMEATINQLNQEVLDNYIVLKVDESCNAQLKQANRVILEVK